jgi:hypothetical protein
MPPVVQIDAKGNLSGSGADAAFIVESIFAHADFSDMRGEIAAFVCQAPAASHTDVVSKIIDFLRQARAAALDEPRRARLDRLDARVQEHLNEALEAGTAYLSRKRDIRKVFWPKLVDQAKADLLVKRVPMVDRSTAIASAGSCFATNVRNALLQLGFNYIRTEENEVASAGWGMIFNARSFRQLVEFAFGLRERPRVLFPVVRPPSYHWLPPGTLLYMDPIREGVFFQSVAEYESSCEAHRQNCRRAFETCEIFIFTLGMSEVWEYKLDGSAMAMEPKSVPAFLVNHRVLSTADNVEELERAFQILIGHNPKLKLVLTVSPVPLHATFRGDDMHVITANGYSKSALRAAADEFCARHPDRVFYFPAYEKILYASDNPWQEDGRHPTAMAVAQVIGLFMQTFLFDDALAEVKAGALETAAVD